jgi:hypothetical protein
VERASRFLCVSRPRPGTGLPLSRDGEPGARRGTGWTPPSSRPPTTRWARRRTRQRYSAGRPFVLYLGTLEPRKNVEALVVACERMWGRRRSRPDLVLAGGAGWKTGSLHRRIARSAYRDKIHVTGYAARDAARELYRSAEAFVYPSLAEGFGLPILEAMACGTPVVASTAEALSRGRRRRRALRASPRRRGSLASHRASARRMPLSASSWRRPGPGARPGSAGKTPPTRRRDDRRGRGRRAVKRSRPGSGSTPAS